MSEAAELLILRLRVGVLLLHQKVGDRINITDTIAKCGSNC
jgi:hypothetical protein